MQKVLKNNQRSSQVGINYYLNNFDLKFNLIMVNDLTFKLAVLSLFSYLNWQLHEDNLFHRNIFI